MLPSMPMLPVLKVWLIVDTVLLLWSGFRFNRPAAGSDYPPAADTPTVRPFHRPRCADQHTGRFPYRLVESESCCVIPGRREAQRNPSWARRAAPPRVIGFAALNPSDEPRRVSLSSEKMPTACGVGRRRLVAEQAPSQVMKLFWCSVTSPVSSMNMSAPGTLSV